MAIIYKTTLEPSKVELLAGWLPSRPWFRAGAGAAGTDAAVPVLVKSGGFRLDDPKGEVGIEFMVATDTSAPEPVAYLVPLTYRSAPLEGAEHALIGTMEHGVLGTRWAYDGFHDPVLVAAVFSLFEGKVPAMAQSISDAVDEEVVCSYAGAPFSLDGFTAAPVDDQDGTWVPTPNGTVLHVHRVLQPVQGQGQVQGQDQDQDQDQVPSLLPDKDAVGYVARGWEDPEGRQVGAVFMSLGEA